MVERQREKVKQKSMKVESYGSRKRHFISGRRRKLHFLNFSQASHSLDSMDVKLLEWIAAVA
jgi:hypothetical protein